MVPRAGSVASKRIASEWPTIRELSRQLPKGDAIKRFPPLSVREVFACGRGSLQQLGRVWQDDDLEMSSTLPVKIG
jgi:hypothetical protein